MITNLQFENFRGFNALKLEGLKRVNLVVGRNNAGKTSLLEGIGAVTNPERFVDMPRLLRSTTGDYNLRYFRWLIRDKENIRAASLEASGPGTECKIRLTRFQNQEMVPAPGGWQEVSSLPFPTGGGMALFAPTDRTIAADHVRKLMDRTGHSRAAAIQTRVAVRVMSVHPHPPEVLVKLFAQAVRKKGGEERIEKLMQQVDDRVIKLRVEPAEDGNHIVVDLGLSEMLPLSQVGQGLYRLVAIFSELIGGQPGICIIDELENGIHHSLLEQVWTGLAVVAEELNIQFFVSTHSYECIQAAHEAFLKRPEYDFSIVQLFRVEGAVQGRVLERVQIEAALSGGIDLR